MWWFIIIGAILGALILAVVCYMQTPQNQNPWIWTGFGAVGGGLIGGLVGWMLFGAVQFARASSRPTTEPTPETRVVEQTRIVVIEQTATPGVPSVPATAISSVASTAAPVSNPAPTSGAPTNTYAVFTPDWTRLDQACPSVNTVLEQHGLTNKVIIVTNPAVSWEPCLVVVEMKPEFRGSTIPLILGYQYNAALVNADVTLFWGGDSTVTNATLQWGTSIRWAPTYQVVKEGKWLNAMNTCELVTREYRFGRYRRNLDSGQPDVPYFGRNGPYLTLPGNISCPGWVPPSLDEVVPHDYLQASAMLGGLANASEWQHSSDMLNWAWRYSAKEAGSATYCPLGDPCWQTTYVPSGPGYIELWLDKGARGPGGSVVSTAGPYKFHSSDLAILLDGFHNVDEFSYHADPNR